MKRQIFRVRWSRDGWVLRTPKGTDIHSPSGLKRVAVSMGRRLARMRWEDRGILTQLVIYGRNGRVQFEHTYGRDPERFVG